MSPPLDRVFLGDIWPQGRPDENDGRDDATWLGFVSPATTAEIARALEHLIPGEVVELVRAAGWHKAQGDEGYEAFAASFELLRQAYRTASESGSGLGVLLC
jgi:hypothetical protein